jgi:hypothetical protein
MFDEKVTEDQHLQYMNTCPFPFEGEIVLAMFFNFCQKIKMPPSYQWAAFCWWRKGLELYILY